MQAYGGYFEFYDVTDENHLTVHAPPPIHSTTQSNDHTLQIKNKIDKTTYSNNGQFSLHQLDHFQQELNYSNICLGLEHKTALAINPQDPNIPQEESLSSLASKETLHPLCTGGWNFFKAMSIAMTYHIPMIHFWLDSDWEARSRPSQNDYCLFPFNDQSDCSIVITPFYYAFAVTLLSWIILPVYLFGITNRILNLRKQ